MSRLWNPLAPIVVLALSTGLAQAQVERVIIKFEDGRGAAGRAAALAAGASLARDLPEVNSAAFHVPAQAIQGLGQNPNIDYIEADQLRVPLAETTPYGIEMVQADLVSEGGSAGDITVCIIDSGIDAAHEDLQSNYLGGTNDSGTGNWFQDGCGHGTHVAGTVAAVEGNGVGVLGVNPGKQINLHIVKVFGNSCSWAYSSDLIAAAYDCRDAGANIISMSLGCSGGPGGGPFACSSRAENAAFQDLYDNSGILNVAAAGNDGNTSKSYPASYDSVVSVAAVDSLGTVADFSQHNDQVELAAPGVTVLSTVPMGTGTIESLTVDAIPYEAIGMEGSPNASGAGALVDCGLGDSICSGASGAVCLIERGNITFDEKATNCELSGGVAAVIYNNADGSFAGTLGDSNANIPTVGISGVDGNFLKDNKLGTSTNVTTMSGGNYAYSDGTSMATPHVSGVAALVWSHDITWTNQEIRDALAATAVDLGAPGRDKDYGFGLVQASAALDYLSNGGPGNSPPTASFTFSCTALSCNFDGSGSTDSDGSIQSYDWNFGDGNTGSGVTVSHTYAAGGTYPVSLTVTDDADATGSDAQSVTVSQPSGGLTLSAAGYKVKGRHHADLTWSGATSTNVDIYLNGGLIATTPNDGFYTHSTNNVGGGSYLYQVCVNGTSICSGIAQVDF